MISPMTVAILISLALALPDSWLPGGTPTSSVLYVSRTGNDAWTGRTPEPNAAFTDGPFATLERARAEIRTIRSTQGLPPGGITVLIRGGVYPLEQTLRLEKMDGGEPGGPIVWGAYPREHVLLTGARRLTTLAPVTDPAVRARLSPSVRDQVRVADLNRDGVLAPREIPQRGEPGLEVFCNGKRLALARWPNEGWLTVADVPQRGDTLVNKGLEREKRYDGVPAGRHYGRIAYDGDRPSRWSDENEIYVHGFWTFDWSDSYQRVSTIDTARREVTLRPPHHHYGYTKNQRYRFLNILEEMDQPGEWYLDRKRGLLYLCPPASAGGLTVEVSVLDGPFIELNECSYTAFERLHISGGRSRGVVIKGGRGNLVGGCTFDNLGNEAVMIDGGESNRVTSCDMNSLALGCVMLRGGDRASLSPGRNVVTNCIMRDFSQWLKTGQYAVVIDGVADTVSHNEISNTPFEALYVRGNEHVVEYNEVHDVTRETGDAGALHTGRDFTWRGNVIRYNYFHDLRGPGLHGVMGVYLDDWASGFSVYGNLFVRAGRATLVGGGRDNVVENNVYIDCSPSVHVDARGLGWAGYFFDGTQPYLTEKMQEVKYAQPPYSARYPELLTLYRDDPAVPKNNRIVGNISCGGRWLDIYDYHAFDFSVVTLRNNLIADSVLLRRRADGEKGWDPYYLNIDLAEGYSLFRNGTGQVPKELAHNMIVPAGTEIVEVCGDTLRFGDRSLLEKVGFRPIPLQQIGTHPDRFRGGRKVPLLSRTSF